MSVSKKDVEYIASLAKLKFTEIELDNYTHHLNDILMYVDKLNELDTSGVEPLSYPVELPLSLRDDVNKESITQSEALKNAPACNDEFFIVPKVINQ